MTRSRRRGILRFVRPATLLALLALVTLACVSASSTGQATAAPAGGVPSTTPIKHVVFIIMENHSFDNIFGAWCEQTSPARCDGTTTGTLPGGATIPLTDATDVIVNVVHSASAQVEAIDNGKMDGFSDLYGCGKSFDYRCYSQYQPQQIPNMISLAEHFSLRTTPLVTGRPPPGECASTRSLQPWTASPATGARPRAHTGSSGRAGVVTPATTQLGPPSGDLSRKYRAVSLTTT